MPIPLNLYDAPNYIKIPPFAEKTFSLFYTEEKPSFINQNYYEILSFTEKFIDCRLLQTKK